MAATKRKSAREQSQRIAYCGIATGLSVALMMLGGLIPLATYCIPLLCGAILLVVMAEFGKGSAWTVWGAASLLTLMLDTDREAAIFYVLLACWPLIKFYVDRIQRKTLRFSCKALFFNIAFMLVQLCMAAIFGFAWLKAELLGEGIWLFVMMLILYNVCMFLYDRLLVGLLLIYANRLRPKLFHK